MAENSFQLRMERGIPAETEPIAPIALVDAPLPEPTDTVLPEPEPTQSEVAYAAPEPQPTPSVEPDREKNLRILRERSERAERERDEAFRIVRDMEARMNQSKSNSVQEEPDIVLDEDALVEGKHLAAYNKKIQKLEAQLNNYHQQSTSINTETRLKNQYPDFDRVVNKDNIDALKEQYPELVSSIASNPDLYAKAVSTYTMLKKLGIAVDDATLIDRERAQKNAAKPRPLVSVSPQQGDSPLARANAFSDGLTPDLQKQLIKEMAAARRSL